LGEPFCIEGWEAGVVVFGLGVLPPAAAVIDIHHDQFAQEGRKRWLRNSAQEVFDLGPPVCCPGGFKAVTQFIHALRQRRRQYCLIANSGSIAHAGSPFVLNPWISHVFVQGDYTRLHDGRGDIEREQGISKAGSRQMWRMMGC
jgi:hypothetical protein